MTVTGTRRQTPVPAGRFWFAKRVWPYARIAILGMLPCPDLASRHRMRRAARRLVALKTWPGMNAASADVAQLAMLRLLWLQRETRRAVRARHREAAVMLARASIETLLLGLYCLREPKAVEQLNAASIRALGDAFAYFEDAGIVPAAVIRECAAKLGKPGAPPKVWDMAKTVDAANGNTSAQDVYRRLYVPLSNFTVHAGGGTLMRHVRHNDRLATAPSRAWNRRSAARVADAAAGILAAAIADDAGLPYGELAAYAGRHEQRALMPVAFMGITGLSGTVKPRQMLRAISLVRQLYRHTPVGQALSPL